MKLIRDQGLFWPDTQLALDVVSQRGRSTRGGIHRDQRGHHDGHEVSARQDYVSWTRAMIEMHKS